MTTKKRSESRQRTVMLAARATPDEAEHLKAAAAKAGVSMSTYLVMGAHLLAKITPTAQPEPAERTAEDKAVEHARLVLRTGGKPADAVGVLLAVAS